MLQPFTQISSSTFDGFGPANDLATMAKEYSENFAAGNIGQAEYKDLLADLKVDELVASSTKEMQQKLMLQNLLGELFSILGKIPLPL